MQFLKLIIRLKKILFFFIFIFIILYLKNNLEIFKIFLKDYKIINNQKIQIKSDAENIFNLKKNNSIFIDLKNFNRSNVNIKIYEFNINKIKDEFGELTLCKNLDYKNFNNKLLHFKFENFLENDCGKNDTENIMFFGEISINNNLTKLEIFLIKVIKKLFERNYFNLDHYSDNDVKYFDNNETYTFYFNKPNLKKINPKVAFILPASEFFNYFNSDNVNNYIDTNRLSNVPFFTKLDKAPIHKGNFFNNNEKIFQKNILIYKFYYDLFGKDKINTIYNFDVDLNTLEKYDIIIFPYHVEYINNHLNLITKLKDKLIISHSPQNFHHELGVMKNFNNEVNGLFFYYSKSQEIFNPRKYDCRIDNLLTFLNDENFRYSELEEYISTKIMTNEKKIGNHTYSCSMNKNSVNVPLITKLKTDQNSTIISFKAASYGRSFMKFDQAKKLIINEIEQFLND